MAKRMITSVNSVQYAELERHPPVLQITATGTPGTRGWSSPELVFQGLSSGVLSYDFLAEAPTGMVTAMLPPTGLEASTVYDGDLSAVTTIRVRSNAHTVEVPYGAGAAPHIDPSEFPISALEGFKLRLLPPGSVGTADFDSGRVNIHVDADNVITDINIG